MQKTILAAAVAAAFGWQGESFAGPTLEERVAAMEQRIRYLEKRVSVQEQVISDKDREIAILRDENGEATAGGGWFQKVEIGGLVEVEVAHSDPEGGDATSDITLATVELGLATQVNDWVGAEVVLLHEEDDTDLEVDVGTITVSPPDRNWFATAGQFYVPFGSFETHLISDPLTLEVAETRESSIQFGFESNGFGGSAYVFNGDNKKGGDDQVDNWGAHVFAATEMESVSASVGAGYINDIGDSDALQDAINANLTNNDVQDHVGGWTVAAMLESGPFSLIGEYVAASDSFRMAELPWGGAGAEPKAWNLEAGYGFQLAGREAVFAVAYQGTEEALAIELPETRWLAGLSVEVVDSTALSIEWAHDEDYDVADGGTGQSTDTLTAQLAVEF